MRDIFCKYKVTPTYTVKYYTYDNLRPPPGKPPGRNISNGYLSQKAMSRLKERVNFMVYMSKNKSLRKSIHMPITNYKLIFITLTLSSAQIHSDIVIKRQLLKPFIQRMQRRWKCINYVWKAEAQDNGNIHFHITTHQFIHWQEIRDTWNTLQETLGYVQRSTYDNPNSTDVCAVYKKRNIAAYIAGEMCKKDLYKKSDDYQKWEEHYYKELLEITGCDLKTKREVGIKRPIEGKLYDCNVQLKSIDATWRENSDITNDLEITQAMGNKPMVSDFFTIYPYKEVTSQLSALKLLMDHFIRDAYIKKI